MIAKLYGLENKSLWQRLYSFSLQVAGGCGNGQVIFAHVIERRLEWRDYEATITGRKTISLRFTLK